MGSKVISSTGRVKEHGGKFARSALGPGSRFIFEGECENPEQMTRNALVTVKDLQINKIEGTPNDLQFLIHFCLGLSVINYIS